MKKRRGRRNKNMTRRKTAGAMLMCATFMLVAAAPLVQSSETDAIHEIVKTENGPPSTCALTWMFVAPADGEWYAHVENHGMRWIIFDMIDLDISDVLIDRDMYRYAVYGNEFDTPPVVMTGGHTYQVTGTPNGPLGTSVTVTDVFEPIVVPEPPVAAFDISIDGLTVAVDASASFDPDGGAIVDYTWDWGDGAMDSGETATHTYVPPEGDLGASTPALGAPQNPYYIAGFTRDSEGVAIPGCTVTITNVNNGGSVVVESSSAGSYMYNLANMGEEYPYADGDEILVEAVKDSLSGSAVGYVDLDAGSSTQIDVVLEGETPPEPFDVTITLTVTDDEGETSTVSQTVTLSP
jgi:hypothetical protein